MANLDRVTVFRIGGDDYTREDLMKMDPVPFRALLHERTHHNIEVSLYPTLLKWQGDPIAGFGTQAQMAFDVWRERGLTEDAEDIDWVKQYLDIAAKIRAADRFELNAPVPDDMIENHLEAGRAAPIGCNLVELRFVILRDPEERKMIWSDISTENAVIIVICYDNRATGVVGQDRSVPQNAGFDAAAAADHMLLMAYALGLGAVWLSEVKRPESTAQKFKEQYGLPDYVEVALHIAVGWPAIGTIKSKRTPLADMILKKR